MTLGRCLAAVVLFLAPLVAEASSLDKDLVRRIVRQHEAKYQDCYAQALGWHPGLKGRLVIRFTVESDGKVSSAVEQLEPGRRFPDEVMASCVAEEFRTLVFPAGSAGFSVTYPMVFTDGASADK